MIFDIILTTFSFFIDLIAKILPVYSVWPDSIFIGLSYFTRTLAGLNFILPIDTLFSCIIFIMGFLTILLTAKIIFMFINFVRGTGKGLEN